MTGKALPLPLARSGRTWSPRAHAIRFGISKLGVTLFTASMAMIFLLPLAYMLLTSFKDSSQMTALNAPLWPATQEMYTAANGQVYTVYEVPTASGVQDLALEKPGRITSTFIDPKTGQEIEWQGNWRGLTPVWLLTISFANFASVLNVLNFPLLLRNTLVVAVFGTIGAVSSAVLVAFGFARFRIPGKNGLFLVLIMTIMLPFQVTLIPQYMGFLAIGWTGTLLPLIVPNFFANAYNVFLLRQYFLTLPRELDEAAQIDGASPLRILWSVVIPQAWPAIIAVSLFHFFFGWNDFFVPLVYLSGHADLFTMTVGLQAFSATYSRAGSGTLTQTAALLAMILPVAVFFVAQRSFMRGVVISGVEK
ncbi:MAG: carbohydrate ABC transporter permease [Candidatus Limnocylindrales bacterium]|jgi:multiple sugar transport system permease protein